MSRKLVNGPILLVSAQSLATSFISAPTVIDYQDNISYQINVTTTNSTGTFRVQVSLDYNPGISIGQANPGNWVDLTLSGSPSVAAANDLIVINLNQLPFRGVRLVYTSTIAGTGHADIYIMSKEI